MKEQEGSLVQTVPSLPLRNLDTQGNVSGASAAVRRDESWDYTTCEPPKTVQSLSYQSFYTWQELRRPERRKKLIGYLPLAGGEAGTKPRSSHSRFHVLPPSFSAFLIFGAFYL